MSNAKDELPLEGPLWDFAVKFYRQPRVSEACLLLQDKAGVDVSLMLLVLFAAIKQHTHLDKRALEEIDRAVAQWREEVIRPLRNLRRRLKHGPAPAPGRASDGIRSLVKSAELRAEQIELAVLAEKLSGGRLSSDRTDLRSTLEAVLDYFAGKDTAPGAAREKDVAEALDVLVDAAGQFGRSEK